MLKLQLSGLDVVHDIIPKGIPSLHISQHAVWGMNVFSTHSYLFGTYKSALLHFFLRFVSTTFVRVTVIDKRTYGLDHNVQKCLNALFCFSVSTIHSVRLKNRTVAAWTNCRCMDELNCRCMDELNCRCMDELKCRCMDEINCLYSTSEIEF